MKAFCQRFSRPSFGLTSEQGNGSTSSGPGTKLAPSLSKEQADLNMEALLRELEEDDHRQQERKAAKKAKKKGEDGVVTRIVLGNDPSSCFCPSRCDTDNTRVRKNRYVFLFGMP